MEYAPGVGEQDRKQMEEALREKGIGIVEVLFSWSQPPQVRIGGKIFRCKDLFASLDDIPHLLASG